MRGDFWDMTRVIGEALDSFDPAQTARLPDDQKVAAMTRIRGLAGRLDAAAAVVTDQVARASAAEHVTGTPLPDFLATREGRTASDGLGQVFQAARIAGHDAVRDAALAGRVSPRHAETIGDQLRHMPEALDAGQVDAAAQAFLDQAPTTTPGRLGRRADKILETVAPDLAPSPGGRAAAAERRRRRAVAGRRLSWWNDGEGSIRLAGRLPELEGMRLVPVLDAFTEAGRCDEHDQAEKLRQERNAGQISSRQYVAAHRELEACGARTGGQRRADALMAMIDVLADLERIPAAGGQTPRLVVTLDYQALRRAAQALQAGDDARARTALGRAGLLDGDTPITAGQLRRVCCDAQILPVVLGGASQVLDVGRTARLVTPALRRALAVRDKGCVFPGCTVASAGCQAHHVIPWWAGGATSLDNLAFVCRHHHGLVEPDRTGWRDQWRIVFDPDTGRPRAVPPERLRPHLPATPNATRPSGDTARQDCAPRPPDHNRPPGSRPTTAGDQEPLIA